MESGDGDMKKYFIIIACIVQMFFFYVGGYFLYHGDSHGLIIALVGIPSTLVFVRKG